MAVDFKAMTAQERNALSTADFAYIDSKGGRHLPIHDAGHVRDAMARFDQQQFESDAAKATARRKILAAARRFGMKPANFFGSFGVSEFTVDFAVQETEEREDTVVLRGPLFQTGDYPDKDFSLTPDEMYEAIANFLEPAPMDFEHRPTVFNNVDMAGLFGEVQRIWASEDSTWLMAEVVKPTWLHRWMPETKVSASFSRDTKDLVGAAWTSTPRIEGAELVAAFAAGRPRHNTPQGQSAMQALHDEAARHGALCSDPGKAGMASRHERSAIQDIHDLTTQHGATCSSTSRGAPSVAEYSSTPDRDTKQPRRKRMGLMDWMIGKAKEEGVELDEAEVRAEFSQPAVDQVDALKRELAERDQKLAERDQTLASFSETQKRHEAEFARAAEQNRRLVAAQFASKRVEAGQVPAGDALEALTELAARIATTDSTAQFAEGEKSTEDLLAAFIDTLPAISLGTEGVPSNSSVLAPRTTTPGADGDKPKELSPEEFDRLLGETSTGRKIIAERQTGDKSAN